MASINKVMLIVELYRDKQMTLAEVSEKVGLSMSTVRARLIEAEALRSQKEAQVLAASKGRLGVHRIGITFVRTEEEKAKIRASRIAWWHERAKGFSLKPNGYIEVTKGPNKFRGAHRVVMEEHLGRPLLTDEIVHHKDGNRANNSLDNLQVMTRAGHASHHAKENFINRERNANGRFS